MGLSSDMLAKARALAANTNHAEADAGYGSRGKVPPGGDWIVRVRTEEPSAGIGTYKHNGTGFETECILFYPSFELIGRDGAASPLDDDSEWEEGQVFRASAMSLVPDSAWSDAPDPGKSLYMARQGLGRFRQYVETATGKEFNNTVDALEAWDKAAAEGLILRINIKEDKNKQNPSQPYKTDYARGVLKAE